ncbi:hypothetical protein PGT21_012494 [Puccinia graminis f. sp. tritici]|uniref:Uncharacterized protein n=1 Tax=Puccinia graminis f. sp. tritici TaxID=56615 RepID=A0A5B0RPJ1_PUCGR|nr:hypothetical protein PGT21_012494 [Puccinia graminis f. sp. tritici]KAA1126753.1 hypothetical protein PGTUg99_015275 [Puccinia graminis f. sp. tritici]
MRQWRGHSHANAAHSRESGLVLSSLAAPLAADHPIVTTRKVAGRVGRHSRWVVTRNLAKRGLPAASTTLFNLWTYPAVNSLELTSAHQSHPTAGGLADSYVATSSKT